MANLKCPRCGNTTVWKAGRYRGRQRYQCSNCFHRFTHFKVKLDVASQNPGNPDSTEYVKDRLVLLSSQEPFEPLPFKRGENVFSHASSIVEEGLNSLLPYNRGRVKPTSSQHLRVVQAPSKMKLEDFKGKLVEFAFWLKKKGRAETTITTQCGSLRTLYNLGAALYDCESIKSVVALKDWTNGMKKNVLNAYQNFAEFANIPLTEIPEYKQKKKLPFIASESELDQLVACAGPKLQPFIQTLKETGARSGEVATLKWEDVDFERHIVTINNAEKGSNPRQLEMSEKLVTMIKRIPQGSELVFGPNANERMRRNFTQTRTRLAFRTQNQRIRKIHLHSFRHWYGTMLYHHTKDIMLVKQKLGHRSITSTQVYVQLLQGHGKEEYVCKVATTLEEAQKLIESGFEYVTSMQIGTMSYQMFRKRKPWKPC